MLGRLKAAASTPRALLIRELVTLVVFYGANVYSDANLHATMVAASVSAATQLVNFTHAPFGPCVAVGGPVERPLHSFDYQALSFPVSVRSTCEFGLQNLNGNTFVPTNHGTLFVAGQIQILNLDTGNEDAMTTVQYVGGPALAAPLRNLSYAWLASILISVVCFLAALRLAWLRAEPVRSAVVFTLCEDLPQLSMIFIFMAFTQARGRACRGSCLRAV